MNMPSKLSPSTSMAHTPRATGAAETIDRVIGEIFAVVQRIAFPFLRISLGGVLFWIGALKYFHPAPIVALLKASFLLSYLATNGFVYLLATLEIIAAVLLLGNIAVRYVGVLVVLLFVGTLAIFFSAPAVTYGTAGFPNLSLAGQFLVKDFVLAAAALTLAAHDIERHARQATEPTMTMATMHAEMDELRQRMERLETRR
jgi:uncharacterized membrane protein YkgB